MLQPERLDAEQRPAAVSGYAAAPDAAADRVADAADGVDQLGRLKSELGWAKSVSLRGSGSAWTSMGERKASFVHAVNTLAARTRTIIADIEVSPADGTEKASSGSRQVLPVLKSITLCSNRLMRTPWQVLRAACS